MTFVDWTIKHEWVGNLADMIERRLCLVFSPKLSLETIHAVVDRLCQAGVVAESDREMEVQNCLSVLENHYGVKLT